MRSIINVIGILLIIFGIVVYGYQGFTYTKKENVAQIGSVQVTAESQKTVYFPPIVGGLSLLAGIILVIVGRKSG